MKKSYNLYCAAQPIFLLYLTLWFSLALAIIGGVMFLYVLIVLASKNRRKNPVVMRRVKVLLVWAISLVVSACLFFSFVMREAYYLFFAILALAICFNIFIEATYGWIKFKNRYLVPAIILFIIALSLFIAKYPRNHSFYISDYINLESPARIIKNEIEWQKEEAEYQRQLLECQSTPGCKPPLDLGMGRVRGSVSLGCSDDDDLNFSWY